MDELRPLRGRSRGAPDERPECLRPRDAVGRQPTCPLEPPQCDRGRRIEAPVDPLRGQTVRAQPKLERRDVPADPPGRELALTEERGPELAELAPGRHADLPGRADPVLALEPQKRVLRHRA